MFTPYSPPPRGHGWRGVANELYWFTALAIDAFYDFDGIVYILARARSDGYFDPLYIGQSSQGGVRLSQHEKMPAARRLGATHVHVYFVESTAARFSIETDLRQRHRPPLNEQSVPASVSGIGGLAGLGSAPPVPPQNYLGGIGSPPVSTFGDLASLFAFDRPTGLDRALASPPPSVPPAPKNRLNELTRASPSSGIGALFGNDWGDFLIRR